MKVWLLFTEGKQENNFVKLFKTNGLSSTFYEVNK